MVVAGTITAFSAIAPAAVTVVAAGGVVGLIFAWRGRRWPGGWPLLAALGVLLVYGAPVLASGQATFTGYIKLDDTATWFNVIDNVMSHGRSVAQLPPSTYRLNFGNGQPGLPTGGVHAPGRRARRSPGSTSPGCSSPTWPAAPPRSPCACTR